MNLPAQSKRRVAVRMGAMAIAHRRANAVGPLWLSCGEHGLQIELLRVGRFASGFALVGSVESASFTVPYVAIRGLVREGEILHLALDERAAAPYTRFALTRFSRDPQAALMRAFRLHNGARLLRWVLPALLAVVSAFLLPVQLVGGQLGPWVVGFAVAWGSWQLLGAWMRRRVCGGAANARLGKEFEQALELRLGLASEAEVRSSVDADVEPAPPRLSELLGRSVRLKRSVLVGALTIVGTLSVALVVKQFGVADIVRLPVGTLRADLSQPVSALTRQAVTLGSPRHPACDCEQVDLPHWRSGLPQVSTVLTPIIGKVAPLSVAFGQTYPVSFDYPVGRRPRVEFELAIVNNANIELDTVDLVVTFARRTRSGRRRVVVERGLHWPAKLRPGQAIKWTVRGKGTEFKVDADLKGRVGPGALESAPIDAFYALQRARLPAVRLHGAMVLAHLGDPRAMSVLKSERLKQLSPPLMTAKQELLAAFAPLRVCDVKPEGEGTSLCLFNDTARLYRKLSVEDDRSEANYPFEDLFVPHRGLRVAIPRAKVGDLGWLRLRDHEGSGRTK